MELGKIVDSLELFDEEMIIRYPMEKDIEGILYVNKGWHEELLFEGDTRPQESDELVKKCLLEDFEGITKNLVVGLIAEIDGEVIGYIFIKKGRSSYFHTANLHIIAVDRKYRKVGVGERLINGAISEAVKNMQTTRIDLETNGDNYPAIRLYQKCGFEIVGRKKNWRYFCGKYVDRVTMVKYNLI